MANIHANGITRKHTQSDPGLVMSLHLINGDAVLCLLGPVAEQHVGLLTRASEFLDSNEPMQEQKVALARMWDCAAPPHRRHWQRTRYDSNNSTPVCRHLDPPWSYQ
jgi:hypothetical protein